MKTVVQIVAFVIGTFIVAFLRSDGGAVTTGDLVFGALIGGGIAAGAAGALFKDAPLPGGAARQPTISPSIKPVVTAAQESPGQEQSDRQQRISQLDKEISSLNQEVDELKRQLPKSQNLSPLVSVLLIIGGLYTPILGPSENIGILLLIGGVSVITGLALIVKRNRFYKINKPVLTEMENKKQRLLQLGREVQGLKNAK